MKIYSIFLWAFTSTVVLRCLLVQCDVSYDGRSILIDGKRRILISGSIHYPRSAPEMWEGLIEKAKEGGLDAIQTYVFWNGHEPSRGQYNFEGRYDLVRFLRTIQRAGLYAVLRLGPYVCAEWNFGGFPVWLKFEQNISFRTDNEAFKNAMRGFTEKIVSLLKSEKLFASQGGPIILSQIENEYGGSLEARLGYSGYQYMSWAAKMAVEMGTGVPWLMCKQEDAPDPVINTCNGFYCEDFTPNRPNKPKMWTEAWTSWFWKFGGTLYRRPVEDLAFAVANFIQKRGSYVNYYMYHGGTNFGRTAGGPFVTTSYDYDAPLDEYGYPRQPNWSHLRELHKAIKLSERALVSAEPTVISLGKYQQAHVYDSSPVCAAFISNYDTKKAAKTSFNNRRYSLPPWSISILPNCQDVIFNTAKVGVQTSRLKMKRTGIVLSNWESYNEDLTSMGGSSTFSTVGILDQINVTRDTTDYLWYTTTVNVHSSESFLHVGKRPTLVVTSAANVVYLFVNGKLCDIGSATRGERRFRLSTEVELQAGRNTISILSAAVGLQNIGTNFETWYIGVMSCSLLGFDKGNKDLTRQKWTYQVGLQGENMNLAYPTDLSPVDWTQNSPATQNRSPLTWYKASFNFYQHDGDEPLALDLKSMGKGQAWINGHNIGRYLLVLAQGNCTNRCGYTGPYRPSKCAQGCGKPTQRMYHVPRSWLKPTGNLLVLLEELGGDPTKITLVKRTVASVCASMAEYHPNFDKWQTESGDHSQTLKGIAKARLQCNAGQLIKRIKFASYGTPLGTCGSYRMGSCHASLSRAIVEENCIGKTSCKIPIRNSYFGIDPCPSDLKRLSVEAQCG